MIFTFCLLIQFLFSVLVSGAKENAPSKVTPRLVALWNLEKMSECRLGYSALAYNDYGCWCGVGGSDTPVDGIDECCHKHDKCYDFAADHHFCFDIPEEYVDDYSWSCANQSKGHPTGEPTCQEGQSACQQHLCFCDKMVTDCWAGYPRPPLKKACTHIKPNTTDAAIEVLDSDDQTINTTSSSNTLIDFLVSVWMFIPTRFIEFF